MGRINRLLLGTVAGNLVGLALLAGAQVLAKFAGEYMALFAYPSLVLIPFSMGFAAAWIWRPLKLRMGQTVLYSLLLTVLGLAGAWLLMGEGVVCLVMVSPLLFVGVLAGAAVGRTWLSKDRDRLNFSVVTPTLVLTILIEPLLRSDREGVIVDELRINAPPAAVWPHVLAFSGITAPADYWLFKLGLPYPVATTSAGNLVGADRQCIFSGDAVFKEKVIEINPAQVLTFDIIESPPDPELIGHLTPKRGQFLLRDNGDGSTTLIGSTWYTLHVRPLWYFDWWTEQVFRAVHLRVMRHVQQLAESGA